jgi:hypothetical protein
VVDFAWLRGRLCVVAWSTLRGCVVDFAWLRGRSFQFFFLFFMLKKQFFYKFPTTSTYLPHVVTEDKQNEFPSIISKIHLVACLQRQWN